MKVDDVLTEEQMKDWATIKRCNDINKYSGIVASVPTFTKRDDFVYVCSPFSSDPIKNVELAKKYCAEIWREGKIPIATHLYFPQFVNDLESSERLRAIGYGEKAVGICSEIRVFGNYISDGMKREITAAVKAGVPIRWCEA